MSQFEYDSTKSQANLEKHGIDFDDVQELWQDSGVVEIDAKTIDEPRTLVIGYIGTKLWSAIITYREGAIRIISVRRARKSEVALYES
ncbi:BrnT family toxin [Gilvimarinus xylanilyticus]|uniref:BrnT family toxin n=1 Tax=Gilvimarinus xylanilyticus TaxID=2944139 RepID=A0A9X2I6K2_9GAMM|nr:BrnT family toxin [Gilvimarinus xylanilyticus]MCP8900367.1 BrnT family toxin [Gilvimarinus xylanilyticus]